MAVSHRSAALNWNPRPLRWPLLALFFLSICAMIALVEVSIQYLPSLSEKSDVPHFDNIITSPNGSDSAVVAKRQISPRDSPWRLSENEKPFPLRRSRESYRYERSRRSPNGTYYPITNGTSTANDTRGHNDGLEGNRDQGSRIIYSGHIHQVIDHHQQDPGSRPPGSAVVEAVYWSFQTGQADKPLLGDLVVDMSGHGNHPCCQGIWMCIFQRETYTGSLVDDGHGGLMPGCRVRQRPTDDTPCPNCDGSLVFLDSDCFWRYKEAMATGPQGLCADQAGNKPGCPVGDGVKKPASDPLKDKEFVTVVDVVRNIAVVATSRAGVAMVMIQVVTGVDGLETTQKRSTTIPSQIVVTRTTAKTFHVTDHAFWRPPRLVTKTDVFGHPTATLTELDDKIVQTLTTLTLTNARGVPTSTVTTRVPITSKTTTLYGTAAGGIATPTATLVEYPTFLSGLDDSGSGFDTVSTAATYFVGFFAPLLLAVLLGLWAAVVSTHIKRRLPFTSMMRLDGAATCDSLFLDPNGCSGKLYSLGFLYRLGNPMPLFADMLVLLSATITILSSNAVGLKLVGSCEADDATGCVTVLAVFLGPARLVEALLVIMAVIVVFVALGLLLRPSGVAASPWTVAAMAALLASSPELKAILKELRSALPLGSSASAATKMLAEGLQGRKFFLWDNMTELGIQVWDPDVKGKNYYASSSSSSPLQQPPMCSPRTSSKFNQWWERLKWISSSERTIPCIFFTLLGGMLSLTLYYETTILDTPFESFMDNQCFGVRTLFATCGVAISFFWDYHFSRQTLLEPYRLMAQRPQPAQSSILVTPPTNPFTGLYHGFRYRNPFTAATSLAAALSKFLPVLLATIPFQATQTWTTHLICAWMTVAILMLHMAVLACSMVVRRPAMLIEPASIAGVMWYLCDSWMVDQFAGLTAVSGRELARQVNGMWMTYRFGRLLGVGGSKEMVGVDFTKGVVQ